MFRNNIDSTQSSPIPIHTSSNGSPKNGLNPTLSSGSLLALLVHKNNILPSDRIEKAKQLLRSNSFIEKPIEPTIQNTAIIHQDFLNFIKQILPTTKWQLGYGGGERPTSWKNKGKYLPKYIAQMIDVINENLTARKDARAILILLQKKAAEAIGTQLTRLKYQLFKLRNNDTKTFYKELAALDPQEIDNERYIQNFYESFERKYSLLIPAHPPTNSFSQMKQTK
ncbi:MAG TPA: hypothetical protein VJL60_05855 [Gammaproteobacteria bacterium]|nr:hypothetical protein [Gammaproteobacteria bacterium]